MRHLFIINPVAKRVKGRVRPIREMISAFFRGCPDLKYDVYVTGWCRDSVAYVQRYVSNMRRACEAGSDECDTVRVHAIGGTGTLFEVVNSVIGFPDTEVAAYPYGMANSFHKYFGVKSEGLFADIGSQVFDGAVEMDVLRCGNNYHGICYGLVGLDAASNAQGDKWVDKGMPGDLSYLLAAFNIIMRGAYSQNYVVEVDGARVEGRFVSVMTANTPGYARNMHPAVDAHPDDGLLDVYMFRDTSKVKLLRSIPTYVLGNYDRLPDLVSHCRAKRVAVSSDAVMCVSIDGEIFYGTSMEYEVMPRAVRVVCPAGIDIAKLPRVYNRPQGGLRGE